MNIKKNIIIDADSYKLSHPIQYPNGTEYISAYISSRKLNKESNTKILFFGLQIYLMEILSNPITQEDINYAEKLLKNHGIEFEKERWEYIVKHHNGILPLKIQALPEGEYIDSGNVLVQIINTDPKCYWLPAYIETAILRAVWYPTSVATRSLEYKKILKKYAMKTSDNVELIDFQCHNFGARGVESFDAASISGAAHLIVHSGTDALTGIQWLNEFYDSNFHGYSVPAAEHSTIISWGKENEKECYAEILKRTMKEKGIVSIVMDSFSINNALDNIVQEITNIAIEKQGKLVIRLDSGDPIEGTVKCLEKLFNKFGSSTNSKGYRVLPDYLRVLQGERVTLITLENILSKLEKEKICSTNVVFGVGCDIVQDINRDTYMFSMNASNIQINGENFGICKSPEGSSFKKSAAGKLAVKYENGKYITDTIDNIQENDNQLRTVMLNGELKIKHTYQEIKKRVEKYLT